MTGTALIVLMLASCAACSGPSTPPGQTPQPPPDAPVVATMSDAVATADPAQCDRMLKHAVELAVALADFTPEERAQLERDTAASYGPECRNLPPGVIECALAAATLDDLAACSGHAE